MARILKSSRKLPKAINKKAAHRNKTLHNSAHENQVNKIVKLLESEEQTLVEKDPTTAYHRGTTRLDQRPEEVQTINNKIEKRRQTLYNSTGKTKETRLLSFSNQK